MKLRDTLPEFEIDIKNIIKISNGLINEVATKNPSPHRLCEIEVLLSGYYVYLGQKSSELQFFMNTKYYTRKLEQGSHYNRHRKLKISQGDAEKFALEDTMKEIQEELDAEYLSNGLKIYCKSLEKVFQAITHKINQFKAEAFLGA